MSKQAQQDVPGLPVRKCQVGPSVLGKEVYNKENAMKPKVGEGLGFAGDVKRKQSVLPTTKDLPTYATEGSVRVVDIISFDQEVLCCKYSENYEYIAAGCADGGLQLYKTDDKSRAKIYIDSDIDMNIAPITGVTHRPISKAFPLTNSFTCCYASGFVKTWDYIYDNCIYTIRENRQTFGLCYHPRWPKFVTYGNDLHIYMYDEERRTQERVLASSTSPSLNDGPSSNVFAAAFNPHSNYELITGGWDDVIYFWDLRAPHAHRTIKGPHIVGEGLDINRSGTEILVCSFQSTPTFQIYDYGTGKLISELPEDIPQSKLYCGKFVNKNYAIIGGTAPNVFQLIDLKGNLPMASVTSLPQSVFSIDIGQVLSEKAQTGRSSDLSNLPRMSFISGRKLYEIEFY